MQLRNCHDCPDGCRGSVCLHCLAFCLSIAILYKKLQGQEPRDSRTAINPDAYQDRAGASRFYFNNSITNGSWNWSKFLTVDNRNTDRFLLKLINPV